ncbi:S-layer family protein [Limnohabitans sp. T6-20]|uniref:beta strand repeat-containing protein n=1 Tax=Limnohabitans sp. T6-20 TaxID=1100725 RepID=UPI0011B1D352|nr:VCBS domain-containing protein [Limnohabitans sp. T6-20]
MATEKIAYKLRINVGGDKTSEMQNLSAGKTARTKAQAGVRYQLQDANKNDAPPEQVRVKRVGKDLHVALGEGEEAAQLIIEDYYAVMPEGFNALVGQADGGSFYEYVLEAPTADSYTLSLAEGQDFTSAVLGGSEVSGSGAALAVLAFNPLLAAGAAGAAGAAAAAGGGGTASAALPNAAPTAVTLNNKTTTLPENTDTTTHVKVADIAVVDDGQGTNTITLSGTDADKFEVVGNALYLKAGEVLDYESGKTQYDVTVNVADSTVSGSQPVTVSYSLGVNNVNEEAPTVTAASQSVTVLESGGIANALAGTPTATIALTKHDPDGDATVSYDTAWMTLNGWIATTPGATYTKAGTYGTATFTVATGVVSYALDNTKLATEQLIEGQQVSDSFAVRVTDNTATASTDAVFSITGANDAPVVQPRYSITNSAAVSTYSENSPGSFISLGTLFGDADTATLSGAKIQISNMVAGDALKYTSGLQFIFATPVDTGATVVYALPAGTNTGTITATYTKATGLMELTGVFTKTEYAQALRNILFVSTSENPTGVTQPNLAGTTPSRTINWQINDGQAENNWSAVATSTVNITAINDAPVVSSNPSSSPFFTENAAAVVTCNSITLADDVGVIASATVKISSNFTSGDELSFTPISGITGSYDPLTGVLTLTGTASMAQYQEILRSVTFTNSGDSPTGTDGTRMIRQLSWQVNDGSFSYKLSNVKSTYINVLAINDAPVLNASVDVQMAPVAARTGAEAATPVGAVGTLVSDLVSGVTDADGVSVLKGISVIGTNRAHGVGYYSLDDGATWLSMDAPGELVSAINGRMLTATARVYYAPAADFVGTVSDAFMFRAWDQTGNSSTDVTAAGHVFNTGTNGGTTSYSVATDTIAITVTPFMGTSAADTLNGGAANDTLAGNGGADVINGGAGNDTVVVNASNVTALSAANMALIDGGADVNVLKLDVTATGITLDLTNTTVAAKVNNFSVVDIKGSGNNTLKLALADVLDMGAVADNAATAGVDEGDMLVVKGDAGDVVQLQAVASWAQAGAQSGATLATTFGSAYGFEAGHTYMQYTQGLATLYVASLVAVI